MRGTAPLLRMATTCGALGVPTACCATCQPVGETEMLGGGGTETTVNDVAALHGPQTAETPTPMLIGVEYVWTWNVVLVAPSGTTTMLSRDATLVFVLVREMRAPPAGAGSFSVTV